MPLRDHPLTWTTVLALLAVSALGVLVPGTLSAAGGECHTDAGDCASAPTTAVAPTPAATAQAARTRYKLKRCGSISTITEGVPAREKITARGISCTTARRIVNAGNEGRGQRPGWVCLGSGEGSWCARGTDAAQEVASTPSVRPYRRYARGDLRVSTARAASWRRCAALTLTNYNGDRVRLSEVRVRQTSCATARRVARSFHGQIIGSSGAAVAAGYSCGYYAKGARVACRRNAAGIRWRERRS